MPEQESTYSFEAELPKDLPLDKNERKVIDSRFRQILADYLEEREIISSEGSAPKLVPSVLRLYIWYTGRHFPGRICYEDEMLFGKLMKETGVPRLSCDKVLEAKIAKEERGFTPWGYEK